MEELDAMIRRMEFAQQVLNAFAAYLQAPILRVEYDDLVRDEAAWFATLCSFLGLPLAEPQSTITKHTSDDLRKVLLNYEQLRSHCEGTPYESMFD